MWCGLPLKPEGWLVLAGTGLSTQRADHLMDRYDGLYYVCKCPEESALTTLNLLALMRPEDIYRIMVKRALRCWREDVAMVGEIRAMGWEARLVTAMDGWFDFMVEEFHKEIGSRVIAQYTAWKRSLVPVVVREPWSMRPKLIQPPHIPERSVLTGEGGV